jgi:hypothetical protein
VSLQDLVSARPLTVLKAFGITRTPGWTRLEAESITEDPTPGLEARIHDPLWLLARQWQTGEFEGADAGTPVSVRIATTSGAIARWQAGDDANASVRDITGAVLLDGLVEREPPAADGPGLRQRAEAGNALLVALEDAGFDRFRQDVLDNCVLPSVSPSADDAAFDRLALMFEGRLPDAELVAKATEAGGGIPAWIVPNDDVERQSLADLFGLWLGWYRAEVQPLPVDAPDSWTARRLEYRFSIGAPSSRGPLTLAAPQFDGVAIDWFTFDSVPGDGLGLPPDTPLQHQTTTLLATPVRTAGLPADRYWEFEDSQVNLGALEVEPHDLGRLLLVEFAMTFASDWLVVPVVVPHGSLTTVDSVTYTNTFGERFLVRSTSALRANDAWRMYTLTGPGAALDGLLVPPASVYVQSGPPVEEVLFMRDEIANLAWAVERIVTEGSGDPRARTNEPGAHVIPDATPGPVSTAEMDYRLESTVPIHWTPYVPTSDGYRSIELVRGRIVGKPGPRGRLLTEAAQQRLFDAEVPRDGVIVSRVPTLVRRTDGVYDRWIGRRVSTGRGEGASGLAFDVARRRS